MIRAFIAIELPGEVKKRLLRIQESLGKREGEPGWVKPSNMHLTLKFLGSIDEERVSTISEALKSAAEDIAPFSVTTKGVVLKGRHLLWVAFKESIELESLKEALDYELEAIGITRDKKPYTPHLTLRRVKKREQFLELKGRLADNETSEEISFFAGSVVLMESELRASSAIHSTVMKIEFHHAKDVDDI